MKRFLNELAIILGTLCLFGVLLYGSVISCAYDKSFYRTFYQENNISASTGLSGDALMRITDNMLGYIQGTREDMQSEEVIGNELRPVFNERELSHMADVRKLFVLGRQLALGAASVFLLCALWLILRSHAANLRWMKMSIATLAGTLLFLLLLVLWAKWDFQGAFTLFHRLVFDNDNWLFYSTDIIIHIWPVQFFSQITYAIGLRFGLLLLCAAGIQALIYIRIRRFHALF